jgi:RNA polymerase sigma factor (sigma-70 family)
MTRVVQACTRLVAYLASRYHVPAGLEVEDLHQEGNIGILLAVRRYEASRGDFVPYAMQWVRARMSRACDVAAGRRGRGSGSVEAVLTGELEDFPAPHPSAEDAAARASERRAVEGLLDALPVREALVVRARLAGATLEEAGEELGYARSWASGVESLAVARLKVAARGLR